MNQALAFGITATGGVLLIKAVTGSSFSEIVQGHPRPVQNSGIVLNIGGQAAGALAPAAGGGTVVGDVTYGDLQQVAAQHGWDASQVQAWANVVKSESNGTISDTNPSSGAYGIAQFINGPGEYSTYGGDSTSVMGQLTAMANYIAQRYQNPANAWSFHQANNWY